MSVTAPIYDGCHDRHRHSRTDVPGAHVAVAVARVVKACRERGGICRVGEAEGKVAVRDADKPFAPAAPVAHELADRQGVEELVGDKVKRSGGHVGKVVMVV